MPPFRHWSLIKIICISCARLWFVTGCVLALAMCVEPSALHAQTYTDLHDFACATDGCDANTPSIPAQGRDGNFYGTLVTGGVNGNGTVYKTTPSGTFTVLHSFSGSDGFEPYSGLTLGTDGNLYGSTYQGGVNNQGTIFKITPTGTLTTLHSFSFADGGLPIGAPVEGKKSGTFYGATLSGTAYSITSTGTFKMLPNRTPGQSYAPLVLASDGNFYGTTITGGLGFGTVFRMSSAGVIKVVYNFDNTHGAEPYGPVVQGSDGFLYGTTRYGGTSDPLNGVVFKLSTGGAITVLHEFDRFSPTDGCEPVAGLVSGLDGNFYGATYSGAAGKGQYGTLFQITKTGTYILLYALDQTHGANPQSTPMQRTDGIIYGATSLGGSGSNGVFYSLNDGISPFVSLVGFPVGTAGQTIGILGNGLTGTAEVKFGSGSATFTVVSDSYLTAVVPTSGTTGTVVVTTPGGTLKSKQTFKVVPVIKSFSPTSGPVGTQVTITGSGFTGASKVSFGGKNATVFTVNSGTQITATVPTGAVSGKIKVTTVGGAATSSGTFNVT